MQQYNIILKNDKAKIYEWISALIILLNVAVFAYLRIAVDKENVAIVSSVTLISSFIVLAVFYYLKKKGRSFKKATIILLFVFAAGWTALGNYWIGILHTGLGILDVLSTQRFILTVDSDNIVYPSFPKQRFTWDTVNNVILKDGLLTIDLKNNKLIQQLIAKESAGYDEKEFNNFCREQLKK